MKNVGIIFFNKLVKEGKKRKWLKWKDKGKKENKRRVYSIIYGFGLGKKSFGECSLKNVYLVSKTKIPKQDSMGVFSFL